MPHNVIQIADDFWNIRGSFRIGGVVDIGTHASLVRLGSGKFVLLDSLTLKGKVRDQVMKLTNQGAHVEAVINLHPFHTVHCAAMQRDFPDARHYGSKRHIKKFPDLKWAKLTVDDPKFHALYADDFDFSVPRGVDFISRNENVHFSSVLAYHKPSRTLHVDDTLTYLKLPLPLRLMGLPGRLSFHLTLGQALERREGATQEFYAWAEEIIERWADMQHLCAAHLANAEGSGLSAQIVDALERTARTLRKHKRKYG